MEKNIYFVLKKKNENASNVNFIMKLCPKGPVFLQATEICLPVRLRRADLLNLYLCGAYAYRFCSPPKCLFIRSDFCTQNIMVLEFPSGINCGGSKRR